MKKYIVFILSLILLYTGVQLLSGWVLTTLYAPDISAVNTRSGEESVFELSPTIQLLGVVLVATLAYFISQRSIVVISNRGPRT
ncbi:hypothetical protein [Planococcus sp. CAU13]|uniref:hypothetical protein n=1 Tax=Planococcus sp. CAU13 TaxID=1541197 RepID=UPI0006901CFC|nr:hypothetical protein [Planococcus sp. CAU13]